MTIDFAKPLDGGNCLALDSNGKLLVAGYNQFL